MMADQYAVFGNPIAHSKSPWIHSEFAKVCGDAVDYKVLEAEPNPEAFIAAVEQFMKAGANGANVTMPFKEVAWSMSDHLTYRAKLAGAVNTLTFTADGKIFGDNTDGVGLVNDLTVNMKVKLRDKRILILGAGGAVKGVLQLLLEQEPTVVHVVNRTVQKAEELAETFNEFGAISAGSYDGLPKQGVFDVIINATPANFSGELPPVSPEIFAASSLAYDMSYAAEPTLFEKWCTENGASKVSNGLGMLVEQAAESFFIWRDRRPATKTVLTDLKKLLGA